MASVNIRLSALTLFFMLLGVILIGFLMNYTWESFTTKEGFTSDFVNSTVVSSELNGKYSVNNVKTAKLMENLFFRVKIKKYQYYQMDINSLLLVAPQKE